LFSAENPVDGLSKSLLILLKVVCTPFKTTPTNMMDADLETVEINANEQIESETHRVEIGDI
jgi:hypothetical protein